MKKICENSIMNDTLERLISKISENFETEIFLSESDLQFTFAQAVKDLGAEDIIMEYPIRTEDLYTNACPDCIKDIKDYYNCKEKDERYNADRTFIDLYFKYNNEEYFVEFKYKLKCPNCTVKRYGKDFCVKTQSANNVCRYQVYEDIERMEHIKKNLPCHSFVVFITNDKGYWETDTMQLRKSKNLPYERSDYNFQLKDGLKTSCSSNDSGLIYISTDKRSKNSGEEKYSRRPIYVSNSYDINWKPFKTISENCGEFKVLVIECGSAKK